MNTDLESVEEIKSLLGKNPVWSLPQASLKFILAHPAICCVIPGMMTPDQIDDGVATLQVSNLDLTILIQLREN
ncbi:aldo/keto reductase [Candidatus Poribacteria bacterium]|nr:aldo/keto reductase [Candidatus Poribacteria bacterium]